MNQDQAYLGDGVYASHDGYQVWLAANDPDNHVVALEPSVLIRLFAYVTALQNRNQSNENS
jgi:hypothetical protein